jgi:hypothetical protein
MGFVQTAFLAALGAVAIPIVIHLIFRRRTRRVDLGTLRFLKVVLKENARRRKVKRWLLLALRMVCVALLAILFARPYLIAYELTGRSDRTIAILIDRSASMELMDQDTRLLDQAVAEAKRIVRTAGEKTDVHLAFFDHAVRPVGGSYSSGSESRAASKRWGDLRAPETTYSATDYGAALAWAHDVCVSSKNRRREIHILTDLQRSGLDWSSAEPLPADVDVHLKDLGRALPNNVAVTAVRLSRTLVRPGETITISCTIFNAGPFPIEKIPVVLKLENENQKRTRAQRISLGPGETATVDFEIPDLGEGLWEGAVEIDVDDQLLFDNRRFVAVMAAPRLRVLLVDGDPHGRPLLAETYFLEAALRLAAPGETYADSPFEATTIAFSETVRLPDLKPTDLVVLANVTRISNRDAQRLSQFVSQGGGLLLFSGENVRPDGYRSLESAGLTVGELVGTKRATDLPWRWQRWNEEHSIFTPFNDPQHGDLRRLSFQAYTRIKPHDGTLVLAEFRNGDPAILERQHGKGKVLWFVTTCDREWSDWSRSRLFLPLVHQMLGYLAGLTDGGPVRNVLLDSTEAVADEIPGVYQRDGFWEVVNPSPRESETDRCTREEFADRFGIKLQEDEETVIRAGAGLKAATTIELRDDEVWHWVVFGLLVMLCVECFLANRTTA